MVVAREILSATSSLHGHTSPPRFVDPSFIAQSVNLIYIPLSCESIVVRCPALGNGLGTFCQCQSKANSLQNVVLKRAYLRCVGF
jgi:hypothetical protein